MIDGGTVEKRGMGGWQMDRYMKQVHVKQRR